MVKVGIVLNAAYMDAEDYECFRGLKIPYIVTDQDFEDNSTDSIVLNNRQGVRAGLNFLWDNGHRDIYYFRNSHDFYNLYERRAAYKEFMQNKGCYKQLNIIETGGSTQEVYTNMLSYLTEKTRLPMAIFSENYEVTIGIFNALLNSGIKIPEDVSLVGFDELPDTTILSVKPVCIRALHDRKARLAINRLLERIEGRAEESIQILVNTEVVSGGKIRIILHMRMVRHIIQSEPPAMYGHSSHKSCS